MNKVLPGLPFVASYSGGKDSVLAIHRAQQSGMKLQALLITYNVDRGRSWFHGIPAEVLAEVERSVGAPVRLIRTTGPEYAAAFEAALAEEKALGARPAFLATSTSRATWTGAATAAGPWAWGPVSPCGRRSGWRWRRSALPAGSNPSSR